MLLRVLSIRFCLSLEPRASTANNIKHVLARNDLDILGGKIRSGKLRYVNLDANHAARGKRQKITRYMYGVPRTETLNSLYIYVCAPAKVVEVYMCLP